MSDAATNADGSEEANIFSNFSNVVDFNFFQVDIDVTGAEIDCGSEFTMANDLYTNGFTLSIINDTRIRLTYFSSSLFTMPNGLKYLFKVRFIGTPGDCFTYEVGDARYSIIPDPPVVSTSVGDFKTACLPSFTVSGHVARPTNVTPCDDAINGGVDNVVVCNESFLGTFGSTCQEDYCYETSHNGNYSLLLNPNFEQTVYASTSAALDCGIETADADLIQAHILTQNIFDEIWEYLAADVYLDELVSGKDIVAINKIVQNAPFSAASWYFPTSESYSAISYPFLTNHPQVEYTLEYNSTSTVTNRDFVAIKNGDLNTSCSACGVPFQSEDLETRSRNELERIWADVTIGSTTFKIEDTKMLTRLHFTSNRKLSVENITLSDQKGNMYYEEVFQGGDGVYHYYAVLVKSKDLKKASALKVVLHGIELSDIQAEYADINYEVHDIEFVESVLTIYPNPAKESITIGTNFTEYNIINSSGEKVLVGTSQQVDISRLVGGVYFIYVTTEVGTQQSKFVKI